MGVRLTDVRPDLIKPEKWPQFRDWLNYMDLTPRERKELVVEWCRLTGVELTEEMIREIGAQGL